MAVLGGGNFPPIRWNQWKCSYNSISVCLAGGHGTWPLFQSPGCVVGCLGWPVGHSTPSCPQPLLLEGIVVR